MCEKTNKNEKMCEKTNKNEKMCEKTNKNVKCNVFVCLFVLFVFFRFNAE